MISFPYGKAALTILVLAALSGAALVSQPIQKKSATLTFWTFAKPHYDSYLKVIPEFERTHPGVKVDLQLVHGTAVTQRLQAAFWADLDVPDLVEVEISSAGSFFRGPIESIGFADITDRVNRDGLLEKMVASRFAPYTRKGRIFGIPHDVHPVQLAYRRDIFEKEGIDVNQIETWDDFIRVGRKLTQFNKRYMIELSDTGRDNVETMLFQRGGGYFDPDGKCILDNEIAIQTMLFYAPLVAGPHRIGNTLGDQQILTKAVEDGYLLCLISPDWRTKAYENDIGRMAGKMALMPLPAVQKGGARTSTWGGTMLGITKKCQDQELAWEFARHIYLNKDDLAERFRLTNIIPPVREAWNHPAFNEPRPYWSGQALGATYAKLAPQVPAQYTSPFITLAKNKLSEALVACTQQYKQNGTKEFEAFVRRRMKQSADEVRRMVARNPY